VICPTQSITLRQSRSPVLERTGTILQEAAMRPCCVTTGLVPHAGIAKFANDLLRPTRLRAAEIFSTLWAAISRLRQSRRHSVRLSPCFRAQRSLCRPIEATNVNKFSLRAKVAGRYVVSGEIEISGWRARACTPFWNQTELRQRIWYRQQKCRQEL